MAGSMSGIKCFSAVMRRGVVPGHLASALRLRSGFGLPVGTGPPPSAPLDENEELIWDDGSPFPEPCLDNVAPMVGKFEALAWLMGGMGFFGLVGLAAAWNNKASRIPFAPRNYPYDNLRIELGKDL